MVWVKSPIADRNHPNLEIASEGLLEQEEGPACVSTNGDNVDRRHRNLQTYQPISYRNCAVISSASLNGQWEKWQLRRTEPQTASAFPLP